MWEVWLDSHHLGPVADWTGLAVIAKVGYGVKKVDRGHSSGPGDLQKNMLVGEKTDDTSSQCCIHFGGP